MDQLKHDWLTEGLIDFEYKKYILLAYLRDIRKRFDRSQLYPFMSDLIFHYRNLMKVKINKELLYESFPESLTKADFQQLKLTYRKIVNDGEVMQELEDIIGFALPKMEGLMEEGKELYEFVEKNIELDTVGISPIYQNEGYLFVSSNATPEVVVFRYQSTLFEHADERYRSVSTSFVSKEYKSISYTYERMKVRLAQRFKDLPNPATFVAMCKLDFPMQETVLPVAKRMLIKSINVT